MFQPAESTDAVQPIESSATAMISAPSFEPFLLVPQTRKFFTGESRRLPIQDLWLIVFFMLFTFLSVILLIGILSEFTDAWRLQQSGVITQGRISSRTISSGKSTSYYLIYQFNVNGSDTKFTRKQAVRHATYEQHPEGSPVTVAYLPNNPNISRLAGKDSDDSVMQTSLPVSIFMVFFTGAFMVFLLRPVARDRWLARNGRILEGKVVKCDGRMAGSKHRYFRLMVQYQFLSPSGLTLSGKQDARRDDMRYKLRPGPGTPVAVLYADDHNYKML